MGAKPAKGASGRLISVFDFLITAITRDDGDPNFLRVLCG
jgi:hypothetical protein